MSEDLKEQLRALQDQLEVINTRVVGEVKVKLPSFWSNKPKLWFRQAEVQFDIGHVTQDSTKYGYVLSMLDPCVAEVVEDIITSPPEQDKYEFLKRELILRLSSSREQNIRQLLGDEQLGDRKPSVFLRHLRSLAGSHGEDDSILRELWIRRLPFEVQRILKAQKDMELNKVAEIADAILDTPVNVQPVSSLYSASIEPSLSAVIKSLELLSKKVDALETSRSRSHSRSNSRSCSRSRSRFHSRLCWYHKRFGTRALKCIAPCSWKQGNAKSN